MKCFETGEGEGARRVERDWKNRKESTEGDSRRETLAEVFITQAPDGSHPGASVLNSTVGMGGSSGRLARGGTALPSRLPIGRIYVRAPGSDDGWSPLLGCHVWTAELTS